MKKLHMVPCMVGVAIVAGFALARGDVALPAIGIALLCPIVMIVMMRTMMGDAHAHGGQSVQDTASDSSQPRTQTPSVDQRAPQRLPRP